MASAEIRVKVSPDGTRYVQPYLGRSAVTGKPIRPYRSFPKDMSDEEVEAAASRWLERVGAAASMGTSCRVGELLEVYVDMLEQSGTASNTVRSYRTWARNYARGLASVAPQDVTTWMVERLYTELMTAGGRDGGPLATRTVRSFAWFLSGFFRWLVQVGVCEANPCTGAHVPYQAQGEAYALDAEAMGAIVPALREEMAAETVGRGQVLRRCTAFLAWLALGTGVRVGEACALRRGDFASMRDLRVCGNVIEAGGLRLVQTTKDRRMRSVAIGPSLAVDIREHVAWQDRVLGRSGIGTISSLPLATVDGSWLRPTTVSREFKQIARDHGLPDGAHFHTLRHTHAAWLLQSGEADMRTLQERLGHGDVATTMRYYGHVLPGRDQQMADIFEGISERFSAMADARAAERG